jgi:hypothetical protein
MSRVPDLPYEEWTPEMHSANETCNTLRFALGQPPLPKSGLPAEDRLFRLRFLPYLCVLLLAGCADRHTGPQWAWVGKIKGGEAGKLRE